MAARLRGNVLSGILTSVFELAGFTVVHDRLEQALSVILTAYMTLRARFF
jgi:hypothetical protein